jgi:hypothetical protein
MGGNNDSLHDCASLYRRTDTVRNNRYDAYHIPLLNAKDIILLVNFTSTPFYTSQGLTL